MAKPFGPESHPISPRTDEISDGEFLEALRIAVGDFAIPKSSIGSEFDLRKSEIDPEEAALNEVHRFRGEI